MKQTYLNANFCKYSDIRKNEIIPLNIKFDEFLKTNLYFNYSKKI